MTFNVTVIKLVLAFCYSRDASVHQQNSVDYACLTQKYITKQNKKDNDFSEGAGVKLYNSSVA